MAITNPVFHLISGIQMGGVETAAIENLKNNYRDLDLYLVVIGKIKLPMMLDNLAESLVDERVIVLDFMSDPIRSVKRLRFLVEKRPAFVVTSLWKSVPIGLFFKLVTSARYISFIHSVKFFHTADSVLNKLSLNLSDQIFADSESTKVHLSKNLKVSKDIFVIPHYLPKSSPRRAYKRAEGLKRETTIAFCYAGRIHRSKGLCRTIEFLKFLEINGFDVVFNVFGPDDGFKSQLIDYSNMLGFDSCNIFFHGALKRDELLLSLGKNDFYIQTSPQEGMAMSVLDAMSCGLVSFVVPSGEIHNYGESYKNCIFLKNSGEFERRIILAISDDEVLEQISIAAFRTVRSLPSFSNVFLQHFKQLK